MADVSFDWGDLGLSSAPADAPTQQKMDWGDLGLQATAAPEQAPPPAATANHATSGPTGNFWTDVGRRIGSAGIGFAAGVGSGVDAFTDPEARKRFDERRAILLGRPAEPGTNLVTGQPDNYTARMDAPGIKDALFNATGGTEYVPETMGGRIGQTALTMAPAAFLNPGSIGTKLATIPSTMAFGAGQQIGAEMFPEHPTTAGTLFGLGMAVATPRVANLPLKPANNSMTPEDAALAKAATQDWQIPLNGAQLTNNPFVNYLNSTLKKLPFSGYGDADAAAQTALNRGVAHTMGENATKVTPEVLNNFRDRYGRTVDDIAARTSIQPDQPLVTTLSDVQAKAANAGLEPAQVKAITDQANKIFDMATKPGGITGEQYQNLIKKGEALDLLQGNGSTTTGQLATQIRRALDDALMRNASPEDVQALKTARAQYKAYKTIEPLTLRSDTVGGARPSTGDISPVALRAAVNQSYDNAARAQLGEIPLNDLAKIGQRFMKEPPDPGTANRMAIAHGLGELGTLSAGVIGAHEAGVSPLYSIPAAAGTALAGRAIGSILRSPIYRDRLINGALNPNGFRFQSPGLLGLGANPDAAAIAQPNRGLLSIYP